MERESVTIAVPKWRKRTITLNVFSFYGGWKPVLRCTTATYYDKKRTEKN